MTDQELIRLLSQKEKAPDGRNAALLLSPQITRQAMRLKKRRQDRIQAAICALAALAFIALTAGLMLLAKNAEDPATILRPALTAGAAGMGMTLLLSPFLAYFSDEERQNEA